MNKGNDNIHRDQPTEATGLKEDCEHGVTTAPHSAVTAAASVILTAPELEPNATPNDNRSTALFSSFCSCSSSAAAAAAAGTATLVAEECVPPTYCHPTTKRLLQWRGGLLRWIAWIPVFGPALVGFGPKLVFALNATELLSKGLANNIIFYSFLPMFMYRFDCDTAQYQRLYAVGGMGWSAKPLIALFSDGVALFGYRRRWLLVLCAVIGALCSFAYALLPPGNASAVAAVSFYTVANYCMANIDILTEGLYARKIRTVPAAGVFLISSMWWISQIGSMVGAFIQGPLSDMGHATIGGWVAGICLTVLLPVFILNLYEELPNRQERDEDDAQTSSYSTEVMAGQVAPSYRERPQEGKENAIERVATSTATLKRTASRDSTPRITTAVEGVIPRRTTERATSPDEPIQAEPQEDEVQEHDGSKTKTQSEDGEVLRRRMIQEKYEKVGAPATRGCATNHHNSGVDDNNDDDTDKSEAEDEVEDCYYCHRSRYIEYNYQTWSSQYRLVVFCVIMTLVVIGLAVVTMTSGTYVLLGASVGTAVVLSVLLFWSVPPVIAKAGFYAFLSHTVYVQISGPLNSFYLADGACVPDGPHFDLFFFYSVAAAVGSFAAMLGVTLFAYVFSSRPYRLTFVVTTVLRAAASIFDLVLVFRWNRAIGIPDGVMYFFGDAVIYQLVYRLSWMPMTILIAQLCPKGSEAMVYATLAAMSNVGGTMASEIGSLLLETVWPVRTHLPCDFQHLWKLIVAGHMVLPLVISPLIYWCIPAHRVCDPMEQGLSQAQEHGEDIKAPERTRCD